MALGGRGIGGTARRAARAALIAGTLCLAAAGLIVLADPGAIFRGMREAAFDRLLVWMPRAAMPNGAVIVDIDRDALAEYGPWPWPRDRLAQLVAAIADAKPAALAIDILLPERSERDGGDDALAAALARAPTVLALVLDPDGPAASPFASAVAVSDAVDLGGLLITPGVIGPAAALANAAQGLGVISLPARDGEPVRTVALLAGGGGTLFAGISAEAVRLAAGGVTMIAAAPPQVLRIGEIMLPLPSDALLRLHFSDAAARQARFIPASAVMAGTISASRLAGRIVFLGASAPEAGGLRRTAADAFMPSVEIEAEAAEQMISGNVPLRLAGMDGIEIAIGLALGLAGILAITLLSPGQAMLAALGLVLAWIIAASGIALGSLRLTDPVAPALIAFFGIQGAGLAQFAVTYRQRLAIERRFALHLPPEVVRRIVENPGDVKLAADTRIITALFTDVEGFTALTERTRPEMLVPLLDRYMETVAGIIVAHGGMVDKFVGDAVHAFFNAPVDLDAHAEKAVACAIAIVNATEALRRERDAAAAGFGRTRIGIETGPAMLGEVGLGTKRDYTAYGRAVNMASRLEAVNKTFGSSIAIGAGTAAMVDGRVPLKILGQVDIAGFDAPVDVYTPEEI
ncbi:adenylate cyclase CyaD1 [soil metagenome]